MSEQKNNTEEKKDGKADDKNKKEQNWGEKIAEQVAGDNELLKNVIKFLTHPLVLIGGLVALFYWLFKGNEQKKKLEATEKENEELKEELSGLEKDFSELKDKHRQLRSRFFMKEEEDEEQEDNSMRGTYRRREKKESSHENNYTRKNRYRSSYLD